jgi:NACHT domain
MRKWPWILATLGSVAVAAAIGVAWWLRGPEQAGVWAAILALLPVAFALFSWAHGTARSLSTSTPSQVDAAARMLVRQVDRQWREEAGRRGLTDPEPLAVRWRATKLPLGDHPRLAGAISGRSDEVARLTDRFLGLRHRRLVVLGPPGAGKTSLAVLLTLDLCRRYRDSGEVVPILLSASSWSPGGETLHTWIERQINVLYPALRAADYGPSAAHSLLAAGRVLPVVDGLDELTKVSEKDALRRINEALREGGPLVVTCRTDEFSVAMEDADVVTAAAVIEAEAVRLEDAEAFLRQAVPPHSPATSGWRALFLRARRAPDAGLAVALSNPLTVWLVRVAYADAGRDPGELADLADLAAIEDRLLGAVVPAVFDTSRQGSQAARTWDVPAAQRWLSFLATHLDHQGTRDLAWWRLCGEAPLIVRMLLFGLLVGLLDEVLVRLPELTSEGAILLAAPALGLVFGVLGASQDQEQRPKRRTLHPLAVWPVSGFGVGLALVGSEAARRDWDQVGLGLALALMAGLGVGLASWLVTRVVPAFQPTRKWTHSAILGLAAALALGSASWLGWGPWKLLAAPFIGLVIWLVGALTVRYLGPETSLRVPWRSPPAFARSIAAWTVVSLAMWFVVGMWGSADPFLGGLAFGALAGLLSPQRPGRATMSFRGRRQAILQALGAFVAGLLVVAAVSLLVQLSRGLQGALLLSVAAFLWLPAVIVVAVTKLAQTPLTTDQPANPRATLRDDRTLTLVTGPLLALVTGPVAAALFAVPFGVVIGIYAVLGFNLGSLAGNLAFGFSFGLIGGLAALALGLGRPWLSYLIARFWLALRGWLPWRLMSFLHDAHRLGLLRQVGPVYQFRHAGLQDWLARQRKPRATVPTPHRDPPPQAGREADRAASA